jgi:hypothetical protein
MSLVQWFNEQHTRAVSNETAENFRGAYFGWVRGQDKKWYPAFSGPKESWWGGLGTRGNTLTMYYGNLLGFKKEGSGPNAIVKPFFGSTLKGQRQFDIADWEIDKEYYSGRNYQQTKDQTRDFFLMSDDELHQYLTYLATGKDPPVFAGIPEGVQGFTAFEDNEDQYTNQDPAALNMRWGIDMIDKFIRRDEPDDGTGRITSTNRQMRGQHESYSWMENVLFRDAFINLAMAQEDAALEDAAFKEQFVWDPYGRTYYNKEVMEKYAPESDPDGEKIFNRFLPAPADGHRPLDKKDFYGDLTYGYTPAKDADELQNQLNKIGSADLTVASQDFYAQRAYCRYIMYTYLPTQDVGNDMYRLLQTDTDHWTTDKRDEFEPNAWLNQRDGYKDRNIMMPYMLPGDKYLPDDMKMEGWRRKNIDEWSEGLWKVENSYTTALDKVEEDKPEEKPEEKPQKKPEKPEPDKPEPDKPKPDKPEVDKQLEEFKELVFEAFERGNAPEWIMKEVPSKKHRGKKAPPREVNISDRTDAVLMMKRLMRDNQWMNTQSQKLFSEYNESLMGAFVELMPELLPTVTGQRTSDFLEDLATGKNLLIPMDHDDMGNAVLPPWIVPDLDNPNVDRAEFDELISHHRNDHVMMNILLPLFDESVEKQTKEALDYAEKSKFDDVALDRLENATLYDNPALAHGQFERVVKYPSVFGGNEHMQYGDIAPDTLTRSERQDYDAPDILQKREVVHEEAPLQLTTPQVISVEA